MLQNDLDILCQAPPNVCLPSLCHIISMHMTKSAGPPPLFVLTASDQNLEVVTALNKSKQVSGNAAAIRVLISACQTLLNTMTTAAVRMQ